MLSTSQTAGQTTDGPQTINALIDKACNRYADQPSFYCSGSQVTYSELAQASENIAAFLSTRLGLEKGERVALMAPNMMAFPVITFGVQRAGLTQVNINPLYTPKELRHQLTDADAKTLFIVDLALPTLAEIIDETPVERIIVIPLFGAGGDNPAGAMADRFSKQTVLSYEAALADGAGAIFRAPIITPDDLAFLQYTGGTTGFAKGAMLSHRNVISNVQQMAHFMQDLLEPGKETAITAIPMYHIFALTVNTIFMTHLGAKNILITNPRDMGGFVADWGRHDISFATGVNTLFNGLINHPDFSGINFDPLKVTIGGGAPVQEAVSQKWQAITGDHIKEGYGLSETAPVLTMTPLNERDFFSSIGTPMPHTEIVIRDDDGNDVAEGEAGELCARGPQVMSGYWRNDGATADVMTEDGFFKTGDVALVGEDGRLRIVDRKKDMILVSGFNVYPNEIEAEVALLDDVLEAACIGYPNEKTGEGVALFITKKSPDLTEESVLAHCRERLTGYKVPSKIVFIDDIPKSTVGKILRRELRDMIPA